jgi:hypothetical protein
MLVVTWDFDAGDKQVARIGDTGNPFFAGVNKSCGSGSRFSL